MSEFQPENTWPVPPANTGGEAPYQGIPDQHGQRIDPQPSFAAPLPVPPASYAAPQPAPTGPPQNPAWGPAPAAWGPAPAAWGPAPAAWSPPPAKKHKSWPWILGIVGGIVVLGGTGAAALLGINGALHADQNDNYTGTPITSADAPTVGDQILFSRDGGVAFEMGSTWVDANDYYDVEGSMGTLPEGASIMGAYITFDPATAVDTPPSLVAVIKGGSENQVGPINVAAVHNDFMEGAMDSFADQGIIATRTGPDAVTTAQGLDGLVSKVSCEFEGIPVRSFVYTFARGERVVFVQVSSYTHRYDIPTASLVTDTLRIDK